MPKNYLEAAVEIAQEAGKILVEELTAAGFKPDKTFDDWPDDGYCVLFRKP